MANLPEITYRYPTAVNGAISDLTPDITIDWSTDMVSTQFSNSSERAANIVLMEDSTSTILPTDFVSYTAASKRLIVRPTSSLSQNKIYRIVVKNGLQSTDGRRSFNAYNWTFTTASGSVADLTLLLPGDSTVQSSTPTFSWTPITFSVSGSSYSVNYLFELDDNYSFASPLYQTTTSSSSLIPVVSLSENTTYYWRIIPYTTVATGAWSSVRSFYYGRILDADVTTRQFFPVTDPFEVIKTSFKNGASNLAAHPTLTITFSSVPASNYASFIEVTSKAVLPRNDNRDTYNESTVAGTWSQTSSALTFTPASAISRNTRYQIKLLPDLANTNGYVLGEEREYYWTGTYSPFYVSPRVIRAKFLGAEQQVPDDLINFYIHMASLEANARNWALQDLPDLSGDSVLESLVRDSGNLQSFGVLKWVEAAAAYKLLKAILFEHLRDIGRTERLGDSMVSLTADFIKGINAALETIKLELEEWENYMMPSNYPLTTPKSFGWSPHSWDYDMSIRDLESRRDDEFGRS